MGALAKEIEAAVGTSVNTAAWETVVHLGIYSVRLCTVVVLVPWDELAKLEKRNGST